MTYLWLIGKKTLRWNCSVTFANNNLYKMWINLVITTFTASCNVTSGLYLRMRPSNHVSILNRLLYPIDQQINEWMNAIELLQTLEKRKKVDTIIHTILSEKLCWQIYFFNSNADICYELLRLYYISIYILKNKEQE